MSRQLDAVMDDVNTAITVSKRTGRRAPLDCGTCSVDANLDALAINPECTTHAPLLPRRPWKGRPR